MFYYLLSITELISDIVDISLNRLISLFYSSELISDVNTLVQQMYILYYLFLT